MVKKIRKIKINGRIIEARICNTIISKFRGLMFRTKSENLLFEFRKPTRQRIHSLFCKPFRAIWLLDGEVIDEKIVKPFSFSVKSKQEFNQLIEIPL